MIFIMSIAFSKHSINFGNIDFRYLEYLCIRTKVYIFLDILYKRFTTQMIITGNGNNIFTIVVFFNDNELHYCN